MICDLPACPCGGVKMCVAGCSVDNPCPEGTACGADHRCAALPCGPQQACPSNFTCTTGGASPSCERKTCAGDGDCGPTGFCVEGLCFDSLGECRALTPIH